MTWEQRNQALHQLVEHPVLELDDDRDTTPILIRTVTLMLGLALMSWMRREQSGWVSCLMEVGSSRRCWGASGCYNTMVVKMMPSKLRPAQPLRRSFASTTIFSKAVGLIVSVRRGR